MFVVVAFTFSIGYVVFKVGKSFTEDDFNINSDQVWCANCQTYHDKETAEKEKQIDLEEKLKSAIEGTLNGRKKNTEQIKDDIKGMERQAALYDKLGDKDDAKKLRAEHLKIGLGFGMQEVGTMAIYRRSMKPGAMFFGQWNMRTLIKSICQILR